MKCQKASYKYESAYPLFMTFKAVEMVAELMALSARTAPKGRGQDSIVIKVVIGEELVELSRELRRLGEARGIKFFLQGRGQPGKERGLPAHRQQGNRQCGPGLRRMRLCHLQRDAGGTKTVPGGRAGKTLPRPQLRHQDG